MDINNFITDCKQRGLNVTYQRLAIYKALIENPVHPTADWVYEQARKTVPNISLGTVYRNLNQLVETKTLQAFRYKNVIHYDSNTENHSHFICDICNQIFDLYHSHEEVISNLNKISNHRITGGQFQMTGICENCKVVN